MANNPHTYCSSTQPSLVSKATTSTKSATAWARTCSTPSRRTTVWVDSAAVPCVRSPSTSSTILDKRSSQSPGRSSACLASSLAVYKRSVRPLVVFWGGFLVLQVLLKHDFLWGYGDKSHCVLPQSPTQLEVQSPPGNTVGYIAQQWHPFSPKFLVANEHNEPVLKIHGPFCGWSCLPDVDFEVGLSKHRNPLNWWKHKPTR